jgi:hypothetical protein
MELLSRTALSSRARWTAADSHTPTAQSNPVQPHSEKQERKGRRSTHHILKQIFRRSIYVRYGVQKESEHAYRSDSMVPAMDVLMIDPEQAAYWYFRLNGFLTTQNFVVHSEEDSAQRTGVDILAVRFPFRAELLTNSMPDDPLLIQESNHPHVIIAEVKTDRCKLNGPWKNRDACNMHRVLTAIGAVPPWEQKAAAEALYVDGVFEGETVFLSLCCLGSRENPDLTNRFPKVPQILWPHVAGFIHERFRLYFEQKRAHKQWDKTGQELWNLATATECADVFSKTLHDALNAFTENQG